MDNGQSSCLEQEDDRRRSRGGITGNCWGDLSIPGNCWGISLFLEALGRSLNFWKLQGRSLKSLLVKKKTFNSRRLLGRSIERVFGAVEAIDLTETAGEISKESLGREEHIRIINAGNSGVSFI